jgi:ABC-type transporter Mla subunit MlaD
VLKEVEKKGAWKQMAEQQQQRINEAAQQFTNALVQSFRATTDRAVGAQEQGAQLTQEFFNRVIENLRTQAEDTRQVGQQLADQQQRATEAGQTLTQESVDAYMDFVNSMFSFWQGSTQAAQRGTERAGGGS